MCSRKSHELRIQNWGFKLAKHGLRIMRVEVNCGTGTWMNAGHSGVLFVSQCPAKYLSCFNFGFLSPSQFPPLACLLVFPLHSISAQHFKGLLDSDEEERVLPSLKDQSWTLYHVLLDEHLKGMPAEVCQFLASWLPS